MGIPPLLFANDSGSLDKITATLCLSSGGRDFGQEKWHTDLTFYWIRILHKRSIIPRAISHLASSRSFPILQFLRRATFPSFLLLYPFAPCRVSLRGVTKSSCQRKRMADWMAAVNVEAWDPGIPWIVLVKTRILWMAKNGGQTKQS